MTRSRIALAVAAILILTSTPALGQSGRPQVIVNGTLVRFPEPPQVVKGVIVAPLRPLAAAFGAAVAWADDAPEGVITSRPGVAVRVTAGETQVVVGAEASTVVLPVAPFRRGRTVWVPAAAVLRALGAHVRLDNEQVVEAMSRVTGVTWRRSGDGIVVRIATTGPVTTRSLVLTDPDRVAVDLAPAAAAFERSKIEVNDADVAAIRAAQFSTRPYVTRVVLDLTHPVPYTVAVETAGVVVTASPQLATPAPPPTTPARPAPAYAPPATRNEPEHPNGAAEPRALPPLSEFADGPGAFHVLGVRYALQDGQGRLTITTSQPVTPIVRQFTYPDRLAVDIPGGVFVPRRQDLEVGSTSIRNVVVEQLQVEPNLARVLVYLQRKAGYATSPVEGRRGLVLVLNDQALGERPVRTVVIDPGHGGGDSGAIGPTGLREADVTLGIAHRIVELLEGHGVRAVLTRSVDTSVAMEDRTDIARREHALAFVSIHANGSQNVGRRGTETYYGSPDSHTLAALIQSEIVRVLKEPDRGIRASDFYVIVNMPAPAVLVETAFISNLSEEALLRDPVVQRRIAEAIVRGLMKFLATRNAVLTP